MTQKKAFADLSKAGQTRRLNQYKEARDQFGLTNGLFTVIRIFDNGEKTVNRPAKDGSVKPTLVHSFGFQMFPAGKTHNEEGLDADKVVTMGELIDVTENTTKLINGLVTASQMLKNKDIKSLRANIDYKINGQYRDIKTMYSKRLQEIMNPVAA